MGPLIEKCVVFQNMTDQLNLPQVDCSQVVETFTDDQWKENVPELTFEGHGKHCEYLCKCLL